MTTNPNALSVASAEIGDVLGELSDALAAPKVQGELPLRISPCRPPETPVHVARHWGLNCFFPPRPVKGGWKIITGDGWKYTIGNHHQLINDGRPAPPITSWSIRHALAFLAIKQVVDADRGDGWFRFRLSEVVARLRPNSDSNPSKTAYQEAASLIVDLWRFWVLVDPQGEPEREFKIVGEVDIEKTIRAKNSPRVVTMKFSRDFLEFQDKMLELGAVPKRLDIMAEIAGEVPQAIYWFLMAPALHHRFDNPWKITLANLLKKMGLPEKKEAKRRKEYFARRGKGGRSIIDRVNSGLTDATGQWRLRVNLAPASDADDWNLLVWTEPTGVAQLPKPDAQRETAKRLSIRRIEQKTRDKQTAEDDKIWINGKATKRAWVEGGGDKAAFTRLLKTAGKSLTNAEMANIRSLAAKSEVDFERISDFVEMAAALIGSGAVTNLFDVLKIEMVENRGPKSPAAALNKRIIRRIRQSALTASEKWLQREAS